MFLKREKPDIMKQRCFSFLAKTSGYKVLIFLFALFLLLNYAFNGLFPFSIQKIKALSGNLGIPDMDLYYSYDRLSYLFHEYGAVGKEIYLKLQWVDMIYPLVYSVFFASLLFLFFGKTKFSNLVFIPFAAATFDFIENIILRISILTYPDMNHLLVHISAVTTFLKWILILLTIVMIIVGLFGRLFKVFQEV